jgi:FADH2 O2-dependent halogenase
LESRFDVVVLGSGFGGSILSTLLASQGQSVLLLDTQAHPRFSIGESSTPLADELLSRLSRTYGIPPLDEISRYGSWKESRPELLCGLKRGFTYLAEEPANTHAPGIRRSLVAASSADDIGDTHWLRSDVDAWLFQLAGSYGVQRHEACTCTLRPDRSGWQITVHPQAATSFTASCPFVVDATGSDRAVLQQLQVPSLTHELKTMSRAVFAHFADVLPCRELLSSRHVDTADFPFDCDAAAVHLLFDDAWMWQLRFDDNTVSAGFAISTAAGNTEPPARAASEQFQDRVNTSPFLREQFRDARVVRPENGIRQTGRLQRLSAAAAGTNWAVLPHTAGFIDPLHSTGIAHTLSGVQRLSRILLSDSTTTDRAEQLAAYSTAVIDEVRCIDELIEGCYASLGQFERFCDWSMLYFAAVTSMEQGHADVEHRPPSFLCANDQPFRKLLQTARRKLAMALEAPNSTHARTFRDWLRSAIAPWNHVGLFDESADGLYRSTAAR